MPVAENALGYLYENGYGTEQNIEAAQSWYQYAAAHGLELGRQNLARLNAAIANMRRQAELKQQKEDAARRAQLSAASQERLALQR